MHLTIGFDVYLKKTININLIYVSVSLADRYNINSNISLFDFIALISPLSINCTSMYTVELFIIVNTFEFTALSCDGKIMGFHFSLKFLIAIVLVIFLPKCLSLTFITKKSLQFAEVRQEAVQQALAEMQNRPKPSLPMPSKRTSMMAKSPDRERHDLCKYNVKHCSY